MPAAKLCEPLIEIATRRIHHAGAVNAVKIVLA